MSTALNTLRSLPRTVWLLGLVSLFNDAASELLYPLVPLYLASVLMSGPRALGIIEGVAEATGSVLKLFAGLLADRRRTTRPWVIGGYALAAVARPLMAFASSWPVVAGLRFADRVSKGLRSSPRDALLARSVDADRRGLAFGLHKAMDNAGAVIGPVAATLLLRAQVPLREVFLYTAIPGALTVLMTLFVREPVLEPVRANMPFRWTLDGFPPRFRRYLAVLALFTLGNSSNMFLLLRAKALGFDDATVPLLWATVQATATVFSTPLSALSDRFGRTRLIVSGWAVYGVFYALLGVVGAVDAPAWVLWPLFAFYGLFLAATEGAEKALVADLAPREMLGTAFGWFNLISGVMLLPASMVFGALWQSAGPLTAFAFSAGCAAAAAVLLRVWVMRPEPV